MLQTVLSVRSVESGTPLASSRTETFLQVHRRSIAFGICVYAALRILVFSAAFPLFNSTDEQFHFDSIIRFANGYRSMPGLPPVSPELARTATLYGSPQYLTPEDALRTFHLDQPIAFLHPPLREEKYQHWFTYWSARKNFEIHSPPLYYMSASLWFRLGSAFGLTSWSLAYWMRFVNAVLYAALVWMGFAFVTEVYPGRSFLGLAVPALLAVFPQDVFLGMNREVLSAPLAALALLLLMYSLREGRWADFYLLGGSFCVGLAFLTDISNAVLFFALAAVLCFRLRRAKMIAARSAAFRLLPRSTLLAAILPVLWVAHNYIVFRDLTASREKIAALGWTVKPFSEIWQHPIFSVHGALYFLEELMKTYWRGEFLWHGRPMTLPAADWFFVLSSYLLIAIFAAHFIRCLSSQPVQILSDRLALALLAASFLFLAVLSLTFDFGRCFYPSRALPYFVSGRIISGTLLPFALIYASGLEVVLSRFRRWIPPEASLAALVLVITLCDFHAKVVVFHSPFNFFSLWAHT